MDEKTKRNITEEIGREYRPSVVMTVYETSSGYGGDRRYYLETRKIRSDGRLGAAKPVSRRFIRGIAESFKDEGEQRPHGRIPGNLLVADARLGCERYVWWDPPCRRMLYFSAELGLEDREYWMPGVVFAVSGQTLYAYAFKGKRLRPETPLLYGPFFNYYESRMVCLGNARAEMPSDVTWQSVIDHWETLFWKSTNMHLMCNPTEGNLTVALKAAINAPYDCSTLRKTGMKLKELL